VTNLVRLGTWALGPALAGEDDGRARPRRSLLAGAGLKVTYDLLLFFSFGRLRPPEEHGTEQEVDTLDAQDAVSTSNSLDSKGA
jgi:hypothetical protein